MLLSLSNKKKDFDPFKMLVFLYILFIITTTFLPLYLKIWKTFTYLILYIYPGFFLHNL